MVGAPIPDVVLSIRPNDVDESVSVHEQGHLFIVSMESFL